MLKQGDLPAKTGGLAPLPVFEEEESWRAIDKVDVISTEFSEIWNSTKDPWHSKGVPENEEKQNDIKSINTKLTAMLDSEYILSQKQFSTTSCPMPKAYLFAARTR